MCFSPEASFAGGMIISTIGILTVRKVHKPSQLVFACIPLFFGIQQFAEGLLWLAIPDPDFRGLLNPSKYIFLIMADVLWPLIIPVSVLLMEENRKRKSALWIIAGLGLILAGYYIYCMLNFPVTPQIKGYHIQYTNGFPKSLAMIAFALYLLVTITPLFISSIKRTHLLGILMFISCLLTAIFYRQYLTSVWCFFAALISAVIFWILKDSKKAFFSKVNDLKI
ncbi:MAG: hypothetical protein HXX13_03095 [Bacteroidetes bacterium]|nr:hypothetical protein [Bacteroidota bacterium]